MGRKPVALKITLPAELMVRVKQDAQQCGVSVRQFVNEATHSALAARCCVHQAPADAPAASEAEDAAG
jgi:hypothetical protein